MRRIPQHPALQAVLSAAAELLGMEVVFLTSVRGGTVTFEQVLPRSNWLGLSTGTTGALAGALCQQLLAGAPSSTAAAADDPHYAEAARPLAVQSYVGVLVRDERGTVVGTLCGIDRGSVPVGPHALTVLEQLAGVVAAHLVPGDEAIELRGQPGGTWAVDGEPAGDLTSAMALADLLAGGGAPATRPTRGEPPADELGRLRTSVRQLEHALAARVVVEQAIGVLAERQRSQPRQAFERLRKAARSRGRKVHDLAREVVLSGGQAGVALPPELERS